MIEIFASEQMSIHGHAQYSNEIYEDDLIIDLSIDGDLSSKLSSVTFSNCRFGKNVTIIGNSAVELSFSGDARGKDSVPETQTSGCEFSGNLCFSSACRSLRRFEIKGALFSNSDCTASLHLLHSDSVHLLDCTFFSYLDASFVDIRPADGNFVLNGSSFNFTPHAKTTKCNTGQMRRGESLNLDGISCENLHLKNVSISEGIKLDRASVTNLHCDSGLFYAKSSDIKRKSDSSIGSLRDLVVGTHHRNSRTYVKFNADGFSYSNIFFEEPRKTEYFSSNAENSIEAIAHALSAGTSSISTFKRFRNYFLDNCEYSVAVLIDIEMKNRAYDRYMKSNNLLQKAAFWIWRYFLGYGMRIRFTLLVTLVPLCLIVPFVWNCPPDLSSSNTDSNYASDGRSYRSPKDQTRAFSVDFCLCVEYVIDEFLPFIELPVSDEYTYSTNSPRFNGDFLYRSLYFILGFVRVVGYFIVPYMLAIFARRFVIYS